MTLEADVAEKAKNFKVLIVDDEKSIRELISKLFGHYNVEGVETADTPSNAIGLVREKKYEPDVVLTDYHMPGETGARTIDFFKKKYAGTKPYVVLMSGVQNEEGYKKENPQSAVPDQFVEKTTDDWIGTIKGILSNAVAYHHQQKQSN